MQEIEAELYVEKVEGTVECMRCGYWGHMDGYIQPNDDKYIQFVCAECNAIERVVNYNSL